MRPEEGPEWSKQDRSDRLAVSPTIAKMEGKVSRGLRYHGGRSSFPEKKPKM